MQKTDVDGTLIHSVGKEANRLHKECFTAGFKEVYGLDTNIDVVEHHGSTGGWVSQAELCMRRSLKSMLPEHNQSSSCKRPVVRRTVQPPE
jgi:hypothetical protein